MKQIRVVFTARALHEVEEAARWWVRHRPKAPAAFHEELERAIALLAAEPGVGVRVRESRLAGVRRVFLHRVRYHVFYRVVEQEPAEIQVLAVWHESRGRAPRL